MCRRRKKSVERKDMKGSDFFSLGNNHDIGTLSLELERKLSENDEKNVTFKRGFHFFLVLAPFTTS